MSFAAIRRRRGRALSSAYVPPTGYDGPAQLPGPRLDAFKTWASPIPNFAAIPSGRRVTVAASTEAALQTAINTAAALTGGDRLVIVPTNFSASCALILPTNADTNYDVIIAWSDVVDGTRPLTRFNRIPITVAANGVSKTGPSGIPKLLTKTVGAGMQQAVITTQKNAACARYKIYGLEMRVQTGLAATNGYQFCYNIIDHGDSATSSAYVATNAPGYLLVSHCVTGGRAFTDTGVWRDWNLGRICYDNAIGFGMLDSWSVEQGSRGSTGQDRGIWGGVASQGPLWIENIRCDYGGGISFMHGGGDPPTGYPPFADAEITRNWVEREPKYNRSSSAAFLDSAGGACQWGSKNQFEIKTGTHVRCHRNVFTGFWNDGQTAQVIIKANNQHGTGRRDATSDIVFAENLVIGGAQGIAVIGIEAHFASVQDGIARLQIRDNVVHCGLIATYPGGAPVRSDGLFVGSNMSGGVTVGYPMQGYSFVNNYFEISTETGGTSAYGGWPYYTGDFVNMMGVSLTYARNVNGITNRDASMDIAGSTTAGLNTVFSPAHYLAGTVITVLDNVFAGSAPSNGSDFNATQHYLTDKAAMGITTGSQPGEFTVNTGSILIAGGVGGVRIGPDFAAINTRRPLIASGVLP